VTEETQTLQNPAIRSAYERELNLHWTEKTNDPINLLLGEEDGLYHHHYAVGDFDRTILNADEGVREKKILAEMHRMETEQVALITDPLLGHLHASSRVMDAGSGRGGTSFMVHDAYGSSVDGINFTQHHIDFSERLAEKRGCADSVRFHNSNMVATEFPDAHFDAVVTNETTMYVDPLEAFREFARVLRPGGRYVGVTWCWNDTTSPRRTEDITAIDKHYVCHINARSRYFAGLERFGLVPTEVTDLTEEAIPYWELRTASELRTGVEPYFLDGYRSGALQYLVIVADRTA
jgi:geranyl diphosphate 2-C-methyltransferase